LKRYLPKEISIDIKKIIKKSQEYFFLAKNASIEKKRAIFSDYHSLVKSELKDFIHFAEGISDQALRNLPWNVRESLNQIREEGRRYLLDVAHFVRNHTIKKGKMLSLKMKEVACITKGKLGKEKEFGLRLSLGLGLQSPSIAKKYHWNLKIKKNKDRKFIKELQRGEFKLFCQINLISRQRLVNATK
jgi:hypothetical protein